LTLETLSPERLLDLHATLTVQVREEKNDVRKEDAEAVRARVLAQRAAQEQEERRKRQEENRPLWVAYHRDLAKELSMRAWEHRRIARELEEETARAV
jgi:hypothetical protein